MAFSGFDMSINEGYPRIFFPSRKARLKTVKREKSRDFPQRLKSLNFDLIRFVI